MQPAVFSKIKKHLLGARYDLSVAFLSAAKMRAVTKKYKKRDHASNVLAFPLSKTSGEIVICRAAAAPFSVPYLFIHGCLHLKGLRHGATMEKREREVLRRFSISQWQKSSQASMSAPTKSRSSSQSSGVRAKRRAF
jgi:ssRNA-specific RNase YbeY (16S rRNA maturation enzyme)